jgi:hypothetical protein
MGVNFQPSSEVDNPWAAQFPWLVMCSDESAFPFCRICDTVVEPLQTRLTDHEKSSEHAEKAASMAHVVFGEADQVPILPKSYKYWFRDICNHKFL